MSPLAPLHNTVRIEADRAVVWAALTTPQHMVDWMGPAEMNLEVRFDPIVDATFTVTGTLHGRFVARGSITAFEPPTRFAYRQLNSQSRLADVPENDTHVRFELVPAERATVVAVTVTGFPTEVIYKHLRFYWSTTLGQLKRVAEAAASSPAER